MKIAIVAACPFPWRRGTPARALGMAEALHRHGHEVHVVTYHLGDGRPLPFQVHRTPNVPTYRKTAPGPSLQKLVLLDPLLALKLASAHKKHGFDLVHAHHYEGLLAARWARRWSRSVPIVYDAHTLLETELPFYGPSSTARVKGIIGRTIDRTLPRSASRITTVTEQIRRRLLQSTGLAEELVSTVPDALEWEYFDDAAQAKQPTEAYKVLGYAGNLAPYQRIDLLLKIAGRVLGSRQDVKLRVVTDSPVAEWESVARDLGIRHRVEFTSADLPALPQALARFDVALSTRTHCDGMPRKLLNYMAAGKPVVSFRGSAQGIEDERTGLIVENEDVEAFASAALRLIDDPELATRLGENGRQQVRAEHTWQRVAEQLEAVYNRVLSARTSAEQADSREQTVGATG